MARGVRTGCLVGLVERQPSPGSAYARQSRSDDVVVEVAEPFPHLPVSFLTLGV